MNNILRSEHTKSILKLGIPIMVGQLGVIIVGFVDNIMVGNYGTHELAAASFVNGVINLAFVIALGYTYGLTPLVASSYAKGDGKLKTLLHSGTLANTIFGLLLTLIMAILLIRVKMLGQPEELIPLIKPYFFIQLVSIIPVIIFNGYKQFVDGVGRTKVSMSAIIISNTVNILFNYLLIFGKFGFPELGLLGAGISTLLARIVALLILLNKVHYTSSFSKVFEENRSTSGAIEKRILRKITHLGTPSAIQMGFEAGSFSIAVILVGWIGSVELAAHQIINTVGTLGFMMFYGMSAAVMIRIGYFYEARRTAEIRKIVHSGIILQVIMVVSLVITLILFRNHLGKIFTQDEEVLRITSILILPLATYQLFDMLQILFSNVLRGIQDVKFTARAAAFCYIVLTISVAYLFGFVFRWGVEGVWWSFPVGFSTLATLLILRYRKVLKKMESQDIQR